MARSNLAYDYSYFEARQQSVKKRPQLHVTRQQALARVFKPRVIFAFTVIVAMLVYIVQNRVRINEVTDEISRLGHELTIMESENVRYMSLLESTASLRVMAQRAEEELGMSKLDQYQTVYVCLYEQDQIILSANPADSPDNKGENGVLAILDYAIGAIKEYIGGK